jgi:ssDNA-binding Zn-finger/Zn-ribbon topoisomerase 1
MASSIIGRTACPECEFEAAHVKLKTDPAPGKEALPYRYCPQCGAQYHPRSKAAAASLLKKTRLEGSSSAEVSPARAHEAPSSAPDAIAPSETSDKTPIAPRPRGVFPGFDL